MSGTTSSSGFGISGLLNQGLNLPEQLLFGGADPFAVGPLVLTDFEIPSSISWGGTQKIVAHDLPGGERVFDVMGRSEDPITWNGIFLGNGAVERAKQFDVLRAAGDVLPLTFGGMSYKIVIESFIPDYKFIYHIPYKISCKVLRDNSAGVPDNTVAADQSVPSDVSSATDAVPADAPAKVVTKATVETTTKGATATQTFEPLSQTAPTTANASLSGSNFPTSTVSMVDLGPSSSLADATPASLSATMGVPYNPISTVPAAMSGAQSSADALATNSYITGGSAGIFGP